MSSDGSSALLLTLSNIIINSSFSQALSAYATIENARKKREKGEREFGKHNLFKKSAFQKKDDRARWL